MKFRTIANERTSLFYLKLKHPYLKIWYLNQLASTDSNKRIITGKALKKEFRINRITFFRKHIWCHFINDQIRGWILLKFFRKNYCRLAVSKVDPKGIVNCFWETVLMLYKYKKRSNGNLDRILYSIDAQHLKYARRPRYFMQFLIKRIGTFKDLSHKSTRRIRDQIMRQRPVILWIKGLHFDVLQSIIVVGFKRRSFFYLDPLDHTKFHIIARKPLLKLWEAAGGQGLSC